MSQMARGWALFLGIMLICLALWGRKPSDRAGPVREPPQRRESNDRRNTYSKENSYTMIDLNNKRARQNPGANIPLFVVAALLSIGTLIYLTVGIIVMVVTMDAMPMLITLFVGVIWLCIIVLVTILLTLRRGLRVKDLSNEDLYKLQTAIESLPPRNDTASTWDPR